MPTPYSPRLKDSSGFTLIELLVVILIMSILGAIGLAAFLHQRAKGEDAVAKVAATAAAKAMEVWHSESDTYAGATAVSLARIEPSLAKAPSLVVVGNIDSFTISVDSTAGSKGGGTFTLAHMNNGTVLRTCTNPGEGGCAHAPDSAGNSW